MKTIAVLVAAFAGIEAYAGHSVVTNEGSVVFRNDVREQIVVTDSYLAADGITSLAFYPTASYKLQPLFPATYTGGTLIGSGQLYISRADAVGPGTITISNLASVIVNDHDTVFNQKVVFSPDRSYIAGLNARVTLTSVGSVGTPSRIRLGRSGAGAASAATLALDGTDSEAVGRIYTSGNLDLTLDGGTVKVKTGAETPFFKSATAADTAKAKISLSGVAFDAEEGVDTYLGLVPEFLREFKTNVLETAEIANGSFEENASGWEIDKTANNQWSGVQSNGATFDTSGDIQWTTTDGVKYLMLRVAQKLRRTITVPSSGKWRVAFKRGCRPGNEGYSLGMTTVVKFGDAGTTVFPAILSLDACHPFKRFETDIMELQAGEYILEVSLQSAEPISINKSMNFDAFKLEKVEIVEVSGTLVKTGAGVLRMSGLDDGRVSVKDGKLSFESGVVSNSRVDVEGGMLELVDGVLGDGSVVSVASGSTLTLSETGGEELIANGSFEIGGSQVNYVAKNPTGWSGAREKETNFNESGFGLQGNGGDITPEKDEGPYTSHGTFTAYLREHCSLSQKVNVAEAGMYRFTFMKACRSRLYSNTMPLYVLVDGKEVMVSGTSEKYVYLPFSVEFALGSGEHEIKFVTGEPKTRESEGAMLLIDDVHLRQVKPQRDINAGTVEMAAGSTLHLGNRNRFRIRNFTVGGKAVTGGRAAAEAAGVTVMGAGKVRFGEPGGMLIIAR